jgi:hypothetical protein
MLKDISSEEIRNSICADSEQIEVSTEPLLQKRRKKIWSDGVDYWEEP